MDSETFDLACSLRTVYKMYMLHRYFSPPLSQTLRPRLGELHKLICVAGGVWGALGVVMIFLCDVLGEWGV